MTQLGTESTIPRSMCLRQAGSGWRGHGGGAADSGILTGIDGAMVHREVAAFGVQG
jgi:hypothetical protein